MVFWINNPHFDIMKKRQVLALIIVVMSSAWMPIAKELFFGLMEFELGGGIKVGHIVSSLGLIGAVGLWKRWF